MGLNAAYGDIHPFRCGSYIRFGKEAGRGIYRLTGKQDALFDEIIRSIIKKISTDRCSVKNQRPYEMTESGLSRAATRAGSHEASAHRDSVTALTIKKSLHRGCTGAELM